LYGSKFGDEKKEPLIKAHIELVMPLALCIRVHGIELANGFAIRFQPVWRTISELNDAVSFGGATAILTTTGCPLATNQNALPEPNANLALPSYCTK
jgi:hypothetical protein